MTKQETSNNCLGIWVQVTHRPSPEALPLDITIHKLFLFSTVGLTNDRRDCMKTSGMVIIYAAPTLTTDMTPLIIWEITVWTQSYVSVSDTGHIFDQRCRCYRGNNNKKWSITWLSLIETKQFWFHCKHWDCLDLAEALREAYFTLVPMKKETPLVQTNRYFLQQIYNYHGW